MRDAVHCLVLLDPAPLGPQISFNVPSSSFASQVKCLPVSFQDVTTNSQNVGLWTVNGSSLRVDCGKPTVQYVADQNTSYPSRSVLSHPSEAWQLTRRSYNLIEVNRKDTWQFWVIQHAAGAFPVQYREIFTGHPLTNTY
jgi:hypothetical protein